ncbi:MAG: hypothetical protein IKV92_08175 [Akkermansia sp.]|nr:hypothetical protein [Akkermansia sp.]
MNPKPFVYSVLVAACALSGAAEPRSNQPRQIEEPPMSYKGAPYLLWLLVYRNDTVLLCETVEETVMPVQHIYEQHNIKVRVLETIKGTPLPDEHLIYAVVYEVGRGNQTKAPGAYPASGKILIGFNRAELRTDSATGLRFTGDLTFSRLNPTALRHLPMVKKDYPELFE